MRRFYTRSARTGTLASVSVAVVILASIAAFFISRSEYQVPTAAFVTISIIAALLFIAAVITSATSAVLFNTIKNSTQENKEAWDIIRFMGEGELRAELNNLFSARRVVPKTWKVTSNVPSPPPSAQTRAFVVGATIITASLVAASLYLLCRKAESS